MRRFLAGLASLALWAVIVWFTVWDHPPSEWEPDSRFIVAMIGVALAAFAVTCPIFDED